ncbi:methionyl-tRNA formyltransferase [Alkalitalea saponilacus]|uniref:Methionyl-tRNA formyltransferase n=1 Tax=Alkalitalea saponilacus TaxID=889453 RepID=A0A1T5HH84_9BACT|nr:methionyl-tRNA formyltransferase [Alkalitalea saponilacus]ASB48138.1 methionyl-tRNA formyltransferase [Alkalitalea saponilacus]SKC20035.1 methionyl-tRNA formyltransferase [Alkalitalea saponilacus]
MENLRIVFMGTPEFASYSLKALSQAGANIVAVITAPDKPAGRGRKLTPSHVKETALELNIPILQPEKLKDPVFLEELKSYKPDLQVVVAFRMLPEQVWNLPPKGTFNLHASLLPQYRGAAPINWAVINGETETGVSTFFLNHDIDTGNIILQQKVVIEPEDDAGTVHDKLMETGARLVVETVNSITENNIKPIPQEKLIKDVELKPAPKIFKEDCKIDWNQQVMAVHNRVRGLSPYPASWTEIETPDGKTTTMKIFKTIPRPSSDLKPGESRTDDKTYILVGTADGDLEIKELQLAGKKRMTLVDFLKGNNWQNGTVLK